MKPELHHGCIRASTNFETNSRNLLSSGGGGGGGGGGVGGGGGGGGGGGLEM